MSTDEIIEIQIENREYVDAKWTNLKKKLPEGVIVLRAKDTRGNWFDRKARFMRSRGWTDVSAEEWAMKRRPNSDISSRDRPTVGLDLKKIMKEMPPPTEEELRRQEARDKFGAQKVKARRHTLASIMGKETKSKIRRGERIDEQIKRLTKDELKVNHIYNGDCIEVLKTFPSNFFHAVVTDPPYNIGKSYKSGIDDTKRAKDYYKWCYEWIDECVRVLRPDGQMVIALWDRFKYHIKVYIDENHADKVRFIQEIGWKTTGVPRAPSGKLRSDITPWLHYGPKLIKGGPVINYTWNLDNVRSWKFVKHTNIVKKNSRYIHPLGKDPSTLMEWYKESNPNEFKSPEGDAFYTLNWMRKFLENFSGDFPDLVDKLYDMPSNIITQRNLPSTHKDRLDHPCQMPVEIPMRMIELMTNPGDNILEPFNGTGTTAHAALIKGRNCTSIELSPDYVHMALDRLTRSDIRKLASIEYWSGRAPEWTADQCTPQFETSDQKSLLHFFQAAGSAAAKIYGEDLVADIGSGNFDL